MDKSTQNVKYLSQKIMNPAIDYVQRLSLKHPHLLQTFNPNIPSMLYFEFSSISLSHLISQRKPNKLFIERDLLALLRGLSSVLAYLQINDISHGNIHPNRVFFDENSGVFKLYDEQLLMGENCGFREAKFTGKRSFLPPELVGNYRNPQISNLRGKYYKGDIFALGLTVIEAACLKSSEDVYDIGSLTIDAGKIEQRLMFIMTHYSRELTHVLRMMVEIDEDVRPDPCELYSILGGSPSNNYASQSSTKECEIDLKKSWDSFENLYKNQGLRRISPENMRRSSCIDDRKEKIMIYQNKNDNGNGRKMLAHSCIMTRGEIKENINFSNVPMFKEHDYVKAINLK